MVAMYPGLLLTQICRCHVSVYNTEPHSPSSPNPSIPVVNTNPLAAGMIPKTPQIIDVDFLEDEKSLQQPKTLATECNSHTLIFPDGKSPHTTYPLALHNTCILPWDYAIRNGKMLLISLLCK